MHRASSSLAPHKIHLALSALIILCTTGCVATDDVIDVVFDPCSQMVVSISPSTDGATTLDETHQLTVEQAIDLWSSVLPIDASWKTSGKLDGARDNLPALAEEKALLVTFRELSPILNGTYVDEDGEILINNALSEKEQAVTLAHEMGHAFGLLHVENSPSVMNAGNKTTAPTDEDADLMRALWSSCNR